MPTSLRGVNPTLDMLLCVKGHPAVCIMQETEISVECGLVQVLTKKGEAKSSASKKRSSAKPRKRKAEVQPDVACEPPKKQTGGPGKKRAAARGTDGGQAQSDKSERKSARKGATREHENAGSKHSLTRQTRQQQSVNDNVGEDEKSGCPSSPQKGKSGTRKQKHGMVSGKPKHSSEAKATEKSKSGEPSAEAAGVHPIPAYQTTPHCTDACMSNNAPLHWFVWRQSLVCVQLPACQDVESTECDSICIYPAGHEHTLSQWIFAGDYSGAYDVPSEDE
jgi:hypothetical protein